MSHQIAVFITDKLTSQTQLVFCDYYRIASEQGGGLRVTFDGFPEASTPNQPFTFHACSINMDQQIHATVIAMWRNSENRLQLITRAHAQRSTHPLQQIANNAPEWQLGNWNDMKQDPFPWLVYADWLDENGGNSDLIRRFIEWHSPALVANRS